MIVSVSEAAWHSSKWRLSARAGVYLPVELESENKTEENVEERENTIKGGRAEWWDGGAAGRGKEGMKR